MSQTDERRPRQERRSEKSAAAKPLELFPAHATATTDNSAGAQLRRRRAASLRCPPLVDGRRDPWSQGRTQSARRLHVEVGRRTAWLFGAKVFDLLDKVGLERRQWDHERRVWMIPVQYADDVMAWAEWKQRRLVTCEAVER